MENAIFFLRVGDVLGESDRFMTVKYSWLGTISLACAPEFESIV